MVLFNVQTIVRIALLLLAALSIGSPAASQEPREPQASTTSSLPDLPVSIEKIRKGLATTPGLSLRALDERPTFRVEVFERRGIEELLETLDFKSPAVPGGVYAYEQQRRLWPAVNYPLAQPYAAFSQGELLQVSLTTLLAKLFAGRLLEAAGNGVRSQAERAARDAVVREFAAFCAAQPYGGAGIEGCDLRFAGAPSIFSPR